MNEELNELESEEQKELTPFELAMKALVKEHHTEMFYIVIDRTNQTMSIGCNTCIQCLKPVLEDFLSEIEPHKEVTKH